jgi:hypothetical protein
MEIPLLNFVCMKILYTALATLFMAACAPRAKTFSHLDYLGTSFTPTDSVAVFVDASAIEKPYTIIGKAYPKAGMLGNLSIKRLQAESVEKAKQNGADAVLIQDYMVYDPSVTSVHKTDSMGKGAVTVANTTLHQHGSQRFAMTFLKYK